MSQYTRSFFRRTKPVENPVAEASHRLFPFFSFPEPAQRLRLIRDSLVTEAIVKMQRDHATMNYTLLTNPLRPLLLSLFLAVGKLRRTTRQQLMCMLEHEGLIDKAQCSLIAQPPSRTDRRPRNHHDQIDTPY